MCCNYFSSIFNKDENDFKEIPYPGIDTIWKAFKNTVNRIPDEFFLGTRDYTVDKSGPYVWKTWREVSIMADDYAKGM